MKKKIARVSELDPINGTYTLSAYLIAQLGKNYADNANERITGDQLLQAAIDTIKNISDYILCNNDLGAIADLINIIENNLSTEEKL